MVDKRIRKTKNAIYNALKELYMEKDIEDISIMELTEKDNIGRKTFYLHYSSIDDVVNEIINNIYKKIEDKYKELYVTRDFNTLFAFLNTYIKEMFLKHEEIIRLIIKNDKKLIIIKKLLIVYALKSKAKWIMPMMWNLN